MTFVCLPIIVTFSFLGAHVSGISKPMHFMCSIETENTYISRVNQMFCCTELNKLTTCLESMKPKHLYITYISKPHLQLSSAVIKAIQSKCPIYRFAVTSERGEQ